MFNIFYLQKDVQFDLLNNLQQMNIPFEKLTQCESFSAFKFNIVKNSQVEQLVDAPVIVPIDYQSTMLSWEKRNKELVDIYELGKQVENCVEEVCNLIPNHKKVFLLYSRTEPYFHDNHLFLVKLADMYPQCSFVVSGNGEQVCHYDLNFGEFKKRKNLFKIPKSWYIDQVHYAKHIEKEQGDIEGREWHYQDWVETPPVGTPEHATAKNKFLLTMRNPRPHRILMSTLIENKLDNITYSRNWSMNALHLMSMYNNSNTKNEYPYHIDLLVTSLKNLLEQNLQDTLYKNVLHTIYHPPHKLDMEDISDRGLPGKWMYDLCDIAIIAGGEGEGYGYIDEKQIIPMAYKKPFILFGCNGMYEELAKLGFKTFDSVFDLSYSTKSTMYKRVKGCAELIETLDAMPLNMFYNLVENCQEEVEFNFNHFTSGKFRLKSNDIFFRELEDACS